MGSLDHLWLNFTEMGRHAEGEELQVIVRGDGCYLEDIGGRRYLDALAGSSDDPAVRDARALVEDVVKNHDNLELAL